MLKMIKQIDGYNRVVVVVVVIVALWLVMTQRNTVGKVWRFGITFRSHPQA